MLFSSFQLFYVGNVFHFYQISVSDILISGIAFEVANDSPKDQESYVMMRNDIRSSTCMILCLCKTFVYVHIFRQLYTVALHYPWVTCSKIVDS